MRNSLFYLDNDDVHRIESYENFGYFEYMLRLSYQTSLSGKMLLYDAALFLFEAETPMWNKEMMMQHTVTTFFLEQLVHSKRVLKFKTFTQQHFHHALFLSAFYCNYCLDIYNEALQQLSNEEQVLLCEADMIDMSMLFDSKYQAYESYPRQLVIAQTKLFKEVQQLWHSRQAEQHIMQQLNKLADDYHFSKNDSNKLLQGDFL